MSAVTERPQVAEIEAQIGELEDEKAALEEFLRTSEAREASLRLHALRVSPRKLPGATSPVERERRKRRESQTRLESVNANLDTLRFLLGEEQRKDRDATVGRINREAAGRQGRILDAYRRFGDRFAELHAAYLEVVAEQRDYEAWRESSSVSTVLGPDYDAWTNMEGRFPIVPAAGDFLRLVEDVYEVSCDPHGAGWRSPDQRPFDDHGELVRVTPDLRGADVPAGLFRHPDVRHSRTGEHRVRHDAVWGRPWNA